MKSIDAIMENEVRLVDEETEEITICPKSMFPFKINEGDLVVQKGEYYIVDEEKTQTSKAIIKDLLKDLGCI